jgi:tRNA(Ile)-lysidine synthetase-like protein
LACTADVLREESEALQHWAVEVFRKEAVTDGHRIVWNIDTLVSLPIGLQKRLVRLSLGQLMDGKHFLSAKNINSVMDLLGEGRSGRLVRIGMCNSVREFDRLVFEAVAGSPPWKFRYALPIPGRVELPLTHTWFEAKLDCPPADSTVLNRWELYLSKTELAAGMLIRNWEPADVYFAPGMASPKRVTDMFAQRKIPRQRRVSWPVVVLNDRVVCVKDFPSSGVIPAQVGEKTRVVVEERSQGS